MARTGGERSKKKILDTAERLFAEAGFDATTVDRIAQRAGLNKAMIYYHFKDKNDLITSLFDRVLSEVERHLEEVIGPEASTSDKIREEVHYLATKKRILTLLVAEALKLRKGNDILFRCAKLVIDHERKYRLADSALTDAQRRWSDLHEFFTGFMPMVLFVILKDKWLEQFDGDSDETEEHFVDIFARTHLATHDPPDL